MVHAYPMLLLPPRSESRRLLSRDLLWLCPLSLVLLFGRLERDTGNLQHAKPTKTGDAKTCFWWSGLSGFGFLLHKATCKGSFGGTTGFSKLFLRACALFRGDVVCHLAGAEPSTQFVKLGVANFFFMMFVAMVVPNFVLSMFFAIVGVHFSAVML